MPKPKHPKDYSVAELRNLHKAEVTAGKTALSFEDWKSNFQSIEQQKPVFAGKMQKSAKKAKKTVKSDIEAINWKTVASMDTIRADHPDWTEDQCRAEFDKITDKAFADLKAKQDADKEQKASTKAAKASSSIPKASSSSPSGAEASTKTTDPEKKTAKKKPDPRAKKTVFKALVEANGINDGEEDKPKGLNQYPRLAPLVKSLPKGHLAYGFTQKQIEYCHQYMLDENSYHAAIRAGYAKTSAETICYALLGDTRMVAYIQHLRDELLSKFKTTPDRIIQELSLIAHANLNEYTSIGLINGRMQRYIDLGKVPAELMRTLVELEIVDVTPTNNEDGAPPIAVIKSKIKQYSKIDAMKMLMGYLGMNKPQEIKFTVDDVDAMIEQVKKSIEQGAKS